MKNSKNLLLLISFFAVSNAHALSNTGPDVPALELKVTVAALYSFENYNACLVKVTKVSEQAKDQKTVENNQLVSIGEPEAYCRELFPTVTSTSTSTSTSTNTGTNTGTSTTTNTSTSTSTSTRPAGKKSSCTMTGNDDWTCSPRPYWETKLDENGTNATKKYWSWAPLGDKSDLAACQARCEREDPTGYCVFKDAPPMGALGVTTSCHWVSVQYCDDLGADFRKLWEGWGEADSNQYVQDAKLHTKSGSCE